MGDDATMKKEIREPEAGDKRFPDAPGRTQYLRSSSSFFVWVEMM